MPDAPRPSARVCATLTAVPAGAWGGGAEVAVAHGGHAMRVGPGGGPVQVPCLAPI